MKKRHSVVLSVLIGCAWLVNLKSEPLPNYPEAHVDHNKQDDFAFDDVLMMAAEKQEQAGYKPSVVNVNPNSLWNRFMSKARAFGLSVLFMCVDAHRWMRIRTAIALAWLKLQFKPRR